MMNSYISVSLVQKEVINNLAVKNLRMKWFSLFLNSFI